jgi:DNA-binding XRE family transcriptional regulator
MSAHMKEHHTREDVCEIVVKIPGKKSVLSYIPTKFVGHLEAFLNKYAERDSVDWTVVAKDSIAKHKQAGMVLRGARFRESISQKELAKLSGVSQDNISRIENGKRKVGEKVAKKLAKPLKINYTLLLEDDIS